MRGIDNRQKPRRKKYFKGVCKAYNKGTIKLCKRKIRSERDLDAHQQKKKIR